MAKIIVAGNTISIQMGVPAEVVDKVAKHCPDAMTLKDSDGNTRFALSTGKANALSQYGAEFKTASKSLGVYTFAEIVDNSVEDVVAYAKERYGNAIVTLIELEGQIAGAVNDADAKAAAINDAVEVIG